MIVSQILSTRTEWSHATNTLGGMLRDRIDVNVELQVGVELQAVPVRIAHVELTCAPACVGDLGAIDNSP